MEEEAQEEEDEEDMSVEDEVERGGEGGDFEGMDEDEFEPGKSTPPLNKIELSEVSQLLKYNVCWFGVLIAWILGREGGRERGRGREGGREKGRGRGREIPILGCCSQFTTLPPPLSPLSPPSPSLSLSLQSAVKVQPMWLAYLGEILIAVSFLLYLVNYISGRNRNTSLAQAW